MINSIKILFGIFSSHSAILYISFFSIFFILHSTNFGWTETNTNERMYIKWEEKINTHSSNTKWNMLIIIKRVGVLRSFQYATCVCFKIFFIGSCVAHSINIIRQNKIYSVLWIIYNKKKSFISPYSKFQRPN